MPPASPRRRQAPATALPLCLPTFVLRSARSTSPAQSAQQLLREDGVLGRGRVTRILNARHPILRFTEASTGAAPNGRGHGLLAPTKDGC